MSDKFLIPHSRNIDDDVEELGELIGNFTVTQDDLNLVRTMQGFSVADNQSYEAYLDSIDANASFNLPTKSSLTPSSVTTGRTSTDSESTQTKFSEMFANLMITLGFGTMSPEGDEYKLLKELAEKVIFEGDVSVRYHSLCDLLIHVVSASGRKELAESVKAIHDSVNVAFKSVDNLVERAKEVEKVSNKLIKKMDSSAEVAAYKETIRSVKEASIRWLAITLPNDEVVRLPYHMATPLFQMDDKDFINLLTQGSNYKEASANLVGFLKPLVKSTSTPSSCIPSRSASHH